MTKTYNLTKENYITQDFNYCYSPACKAYKEFILENNCISNSYNEDIKDYNYISIITKKKYTIGTQVSAKCSFDSFGAPLIVFTDEVSMNKDNKLEYALHFEVVAYEDGCNVWHIVPFPEDTECPRKSTLIGNLKFKIPDKSLVDINVTFLEKQILINVNGHEFFVSHPEFPDCFHVGITACEGINHFYEFTINGKDN